jgi:hypothetical protein
MSDVAVSYINGLSLHEYQEAHAAICKEEHNQPQQKWDTEQTLMLHVIRHGYITSEGYAILARPTRNCTKHYQNEW